MEAARQRARRRELWAAGVIRTAAFLVLGFTFLLFAYLLLEVIPLLRPARLGSPVQVEGGGGLLQFPAELPNSLWVVEGDGRVRVLPQGDEVQLPEARPPLRAAVADRWGRLLAVVDGQGLQLYRLTLRPTFVGQERRLHLKVSRLGAASEEAVWLLAVGGGAEPLVVGTKGGSTLLWQLRQGTLHPFPLGVGEARVAAVADAGDRVWLSLRRELAVYHAETQELLARAPLSAEATALTLLLGDVTCLVGDASGQVAAFGFYQEGGTYLVERFASFSGPGPVLALAPSPRNKAFAVLRPGLLQVAYLTSRKVLAERSIAPEVRLALAFAPRGERLQAVSPSGFVHHVAVNLGHPEITLRTLFGKVRYEGYRDSSWTWQSTGGSNAFEGKFSLVPLLFGSIKGAFYAMLFSAPLGLLAALYASQFAPAGFRRWVKPVVELLAGVPSVVVGFVAALVLAPWVAQHLGTVLLALVVLPLVLVGTGWLCELQPRPWQLRLQRRGELPLTLALVALALVLTALVGPWLERQLFPQGLLELLHRAWGVAYDQRNALVTGFALGFAVLPVIFTLAEEALSNVPESLTNAALSLGASRARAAWTVVVPAATPGLVAALLLGFGRAVGETMIVLMASGNAPVLSLSPFSGMRTMAACIAVELPEAAYGETLYRVLLLVALLLFAFTLTTNLVGHHISRSLRARFGVSP
ncbi:MAG: ABC transporter permease subunit [Thermoanaerobaculum sp.]|nr:ABC transporter permease subunit [Thermoanaerobaculum sp.]